jgi:cation diffusion facilitator CzcD-associated flavoprotein CzcO
VTTALDAEVIVAGAGFAGVGMGIALKRAGIERFIILERAEEIGGTWRENDYPGCACDIPAMLYSYSFEPNVAWSRTYPSRREIWDYLRGCADKYGVRPHIRFDCALEEARFDDATATWTVETSQGVLRSRVLVLALGALDRPRIPHLPGVERFTGPAFHSARWRNDVDLRDKRVAVIGTGASAIQFVPHIAPLVRSLTIFQRSAPWVMPKGDRPVSRTVRALRAFPPYAWLVRKAVYWALEARAYGFTVDPRPLGLFERFARRHLERQVPDPVLRRTLTPDHRMGCKRVLLADDYYPALTRENVEVVTTPIREVREDAIVTTDGAEHPAGVLIYATGFRATDALAPVRVYGSAGRELNADWQAGAQAYLGTSVAGYPNLFLLIGPNTGLGHNSMILMIEAQIRYVMSALAHMRRTGASGLAVRGHVQDAFNERLQRRMKRTVWSSGCTSWYLDSSGKNTTLWPGFTFTYRFLTRRLRPEDYEASTATPQRTNA